MSYTFYGWQSPPSKTQMKMDLWRHEKDYEIFISEQYTAAYHLRAFDQMAAALGKTITEIASSHGMTVKPCAEGDELAVYGAECGGCMSISSYFTVTFIALQIPFCALTHVEKQWNSQLARRIIMALLRELSQGEQGFPSSLITIGLSYVSSCTEVDMMLYCMIRIRDDVPIRDADDAVQPFETEASVKGHREGSMPRGG